MTRLEGFGSAACPQPERAAAAGATLVLYLLSRDADVAAGLITLIDALGYGPTFLRGWRELRKDSVSSFALNAVKFVPSLMAVDPISFAASFYPATLTVLDTSVAVMLIVRRLGLARRA